MSHHFILILHLSAAAVWVGGHLLLALRYLPKALKSQNVRIIQDFEKQYEPLGLPSLLILVASGIYMAYDYGIGVSHWFNFDNPLERVVSIKLLLLLSTVGLAVHARFFIIPKLSDDNLKEMAVHIFLITAIGMAMLVLGTCMRYGGI